VRGWWLVRRSGDSVGFWDIFPSVYFRHVETHFDVEFCDVRCAGRRTG
jgi:hypothetical protein